MQIGATSLAFLLMENKTETLAANNDENTSVIFLMKY